MTYKGVLSERANAGILSIVDFIALDNEARAVAVAERLKDRMTKKLSQFPNSGVAVGHFRFSVFDNYVVVYLVDEGVQVVTVVMVTEGHRNWRAMFEDEG